MFGFGRPSEKRVYSVVPSFIIWINLVTYTVPLLHPSMASAVLATCGEPRRAMPLSQQVPRVTTRGARRRQSQQFLIELPRDHDLTPLLLSFDLLHLAALACTSSVWRQAVETFRAGAPTVDFYPLQYAHRMRSSTPPLSQFVLVVLPRYINLRKLDLPGYANEEQAAVVQSLPMLESVSVDVRTPAAVSALCTAFASLPRLRLIDLVGNYSSVVTGAHVASLLGACPQLRRLSVNARWHPLHRPLEHALTETATGSGCPLFEQLYMSFGRTRFESHESPWLGPTLLSIFESCPSLRVLHLHDFVWEMPFVATVGQHCAQLTVLSLQGCTRLATDSIVVVGQVCSRLQVVDVRGCVNVADAAFSSLAQGCPVLRDVDAVKTAISQVGLAALLGNPVLKRLVVRDWDNLTTQDVEAARTQRPDIEGMFCGPIHVKVVAQDGTEIYFKCKCDKPLQKLMHMFCNRQGVSTNSVRFLFDGNRINETQTPIQLDMEDGDVIDVMVEQQALPWASPNPAEPSGAASEQLLLHDAAEATALAPAAVAALVARCSTPHLKRARAGVVQVQELLSAAECAALIAHAERWRAATAGEQAGSWTLEVSCHDMTELVGSAAMAQLYTLGHNALDASLGTATEPPPPPRIVLRCRRAAPAECIRFHRDSRRVVVHTPLSAAHVGGSLLLAHGGELCAADATPGWATAIDNAVVHGVSSVTAGARYVMLAAFDQW